MSEISASQCRPNLYPYRRRIRGCLTETDNGRQAGPDREDVLALIDYHHDNPVKMQDFLQHLDAGIPYQYISNRLLPELRRTKIRVCLSYPEEKEGKNSSTEQAAMIEETEFIPIDRETTIAPIAVQALPQKERRQVITETEKTVNKGRKGKRDKRKGSKKRQDSRQHSACTEK